MLGASRGLEGAPCVAEAGALDVGRGVDVCDEPDLEREEDAFTCDGLAVGEDGGASAVEASGCDGVRREECCEGVR